MIKRLTMIVQAMSGRKEYAYWERESTEFGGAQKWQSVGNLLHL